MRDENKSCLTEQGQVAQKMAADQSINTCLGAAVGYADPSQSVRRRLMQTEHEAQNLLKATLILEQHPEFNDFLWLLRSGLV